MANSAAPNAFTTRIPTMFSWNTLDRSPMRDWARAECFRILRPITATIPARIGNTARQRSARRQLATNTTAR